MKNIKQSTALLLLFVGMFGACKKDPTTYSKGFSSFEFVVKDPITSVETKYPGTISESEIVVELPIEVDVTNLKASFTTDNPRTIVQVGSDVQESGITEHNFTNPINYSVKAEDRSTRGYSVRVEKKTALKSFGFYKEDNPLLTTDYKAVIKGFNVQIALPETVNLTTLVARFETTTGAIMKINTTVQESKVTVNDFTLPVVYSFSAAGLANPVNYTVNISFIGRQWTLLANNITGLVTAAGIKVAINPNNNYPYFIYYRTGKDESGNTIAPDNRKAAVMGYNGTAFTNLGSAQGISDFRADVPAIAFSNDGTLYVGYKDYLNAEQKATVQKYNGTSWSVVGSSRFSPVRSDYFSLTLSSNDIPIVSMAKSGTDATGIANRGLYVSSFTSGSWNAITPSGGITIFYDQLIKGLDNKTYLGIMDRTTGVNKPSLFKYENNVWTAIGQTSFTAPDNVVGFQSVSVAVDKTGQAYLAYQANPSTGRINHVMKFNKEANTWQELGNAVITGGVSDNFALAVDSDNQLYFAYCNASSLIVKTFNTNTNNWNTERKVISEKINTFDMQIAADGTVYIVASLTADNRTVVYKYAK